MRIMRAVRFVRTRLSFIMLSDAGINPPPPSFMSLNRRFWFCFLQLIGIPLLVYLHERFAVSGAVVRMDWSVSSEHQLRSTNAPHAAAWATIRLLRPLLHYTFASHETCTVTLSFFLKFKLL